MLANNLKDVIVLVDKDRVKSGLFAIKESKPTRSCSMTACNICTSSTGSRSS